jgi:predicted amino acid-binding ACT domain protein
LMMLVDVPTQHVEIMQNKIRALPDLESAVFTVNPVDKSHSSPPPVGCTWDHVLLALLYRPEAPIVGRQCFLTQSNNSTHYYLHTDSGDFSLSGADNPGIVHTMTSALARHGLSIDKLATDQQIAPYGGTTLFTMHGTVVRLGPLPKSFDIGRIKQELEELGDSLNCDVKMEDSVDESYQGSFYAG